MKRRLSKDAIASWRVALAQNEDVICGVLRSSTHYVAADEIAKAFKALDQELKFIGELAEEEPNV